MCRRTVSNSKSTRCWGGDAVAFLGTPTFLRNVRIFVAIIATASSSGVWALDCNNNGVEDQHDVVRDSMDCNLNGIPDECENAPITLELGNDIVEVARTPRVLKTADVNRDDVPDVVQISHFRGNSHLTVLLGTGGQSLVSIAEYSLEGLAYSVVAGDFDSDEKLDLVTVNGLTYLFLKGRGDGTFEDPVSYDHTIESRTVDALDVDGNGSLDLIFGDRAAGTLSLRLGDGTGGFGNAQSFLISGDPRVVLAEDFNGDEITDVATLNSISNEITVLLGTGQGGFVDASAYPLSLTPFAFLDSADFDRDGTPDLVALLVNTLVLLFNNGDGTFADPVEIAIPNAIMLQAGDFNGDARVDLAVVLRTRSVVVHENDGHGNFDVTTPSPNMASLPTALAAGDYDGNGSLDLTLTTVVPSGVLVMWNGLGESVAVDRVTFPTPGSPHSGTIADVNGDGWLDVIGSSTHKGSFHVFLNDGMGGFLQQPKYTFGNEHPQSVAPGDVDGDGDVDLVTPDNISNDLWIHLNRGDGTFETPRRFPAGLAPINVKLDDLNSDGHLDAVTADQSETAVSVFFGLGDGNFAERSSYRVGRSPKASALADFDGDGHVDILVANSADTFVTILTNQGNGTFNDARTDLRILYQPNDIFSSDLNNDGAMDIVTANTVGSSVTTILNQGDGTFGEPENYPVGTPPYSVISVDFNLDGNNDLVTGNETGNTVSILLGRGNGRVDVPRIFPSGQGIRFVLGGDFDQDGDVDLATVDRGGNSMTILYNESESAINQPQFLTKICTSSDFHRITAPASGAVGAVKFTKYILHVGDAPTLLPEVAFQNTERYPLHEDFLTAVFPDQFPALTAKLYNDLVGVRATREYFVGVVTSLRVGSDLIYGFSVFAQFNDPAERLSVAEVKSLYDKLRIAFELEPLAYFPTSRAAIEVATEWVQPGALDPGFPIHFGATAPPSFDYEPYTVGAGVGRVRILDPTEFATANANGEFSFQDILVLTQAPRDIEGVVSGVITAEIQGELSHISVRTNRRGTPNAFVLDALEMFTPFEGKLVQLEVDCAGPIIKEVTPSEAEAFWATRRPTLSTLPQLDNDYTGLPTLGEVLGMDGTAEMPIEARFGGKVSGFARLQGLLTGSEVEQYQELGFAIPVRHYLDFMRSNQITSALDASRLVTYEDYLLELFADGEFQTNPRLRFDALKALRDHIEDESIVDPGLVETIGRRILDVFNAPQERVRFRSSSNVEDAAEFNGAGLYDSTSVCVADDFDNDTSGPSLCQAFKNNERGVARGLQRVWGSLWNFRAYEEREFYGIPQDLAGMAVLVNRAFVQERANGVAFTGNPTNPLDRRYVITVQLGEESVVSPEPGVIAEKNVVEVDANGQVERILRAIPSSLLPRGNFVLSSDDLRELGELMWHVDRDFPLDTHLYDRSEFLLDLEFKIESTGDLAVKQVRPFLLTNPAPPTPTFELVIPAGMMACGMFDQARGPLIEHERKSTVLFKSGPLSLPTSLESFSGELIEQVVFGQEQQVAEPTGPGVFEVEILDAEGSEQQIYRFRYQQEFQLPDGEALVFELSQLDFRADECSTEGETRQLSADVLTDGVFLRSGVTAGERIIDVLYSACGHQTLPVWEIDAKLADGTQLLLHERYRPEPLRDFGPASLVSGVVDISGEHIKTSDYFDLVYSAVRHNEHVIHWVVFDNSVAMEGVPTPIRGIELQAPEASEGLEAKAFYLDDDLTPISEIGVVSYGRERVTVDPSAPFQRGDVDGNGNVTFPDVVGLLRFLFASGSAPACQKSADSDDDGRVNVADAIWILLHLFAGRESLPPPFGSCGFDTTQDDLSCNTYPGCL